jgi:very-short-patch-repair endonuclease
LKKKRSNPRVVHSDGTESNLERLFLTQWLERYPDLKPLLQVKFHPKRNWTFDFCWPTQKIAIEVQGMGPGHCSLRGMTGDYDKLLAALLRGWRIVYLTTTHLTPRRIDDVCVDIAKLLGVVTPIASGYVPIHKRKLS